MNIVKIYKTAACLTMAAAISCISAGCYLLPDEEEVLPAPTVMASEVEYTTVTAERKDLEKRIVATGTIAAANQYNLVYEKQGGTISAFYVHAGDTVESGDPICALNTQELDYQIELQELYLRRAELDVEVIAEGGGTQAEVDRAYVEVELINHELEQLYEQKEAATLTSPVDGTVYSLADVRVGDNVSTGQTIATIIDTSELYIAIQPSSYSPFEIGTEVQIRIDESYYTGEVFMNPDELIEYQAQQEESHDEVDDTGITFEPDTVYVRFIGEIPTDCVGQLADCILVQERVEDAIVISNNLIKTVNGEQVVYILQDGERVAVNVETGLETGSQTEIISGINEGDQLILR